MTKRKVWRYRCGFCKRSNCCGAAIATHERGCTANPERVCRMCAHADYQQKPIATLVGVLRAHVEDEDWPKALGELRQSAHGCPACILAAIRQSGLQMTAEDPPWPGELRFDFNFKDEVDSFWKRVNEEEYEKDQRAELEAQW